jgi:hypothetical protein
MVCGQGRVELPNSLLYVFRLAWHLETRPANLHAAPAPPYSITIMTSQTPSTHAERLSACVPAEEAAKLFGLDAKSTGFGVVATFFDAPGTSSWQWTFVFL